MDLHPALSLLGEPLLQQELLMEWMLHQQFRWNFHRITWL